MAEGYPTVSVRVTSKRAALKDIPLAERFWSKVDRSGECWVWTAGKCGDGYGFFYDVTTRRSRAAHRVAFELANGPIPDGLLVLHRCDNPPCVRPDHLFVGTNADNMADCVAKGRKASGLRNGAYTKPESRARGDRNGSRLHPERRPRGDSHWMRQRPEGYLRGSSKVNAKLTEEIVRTMRRLYASGECTGAELGRRYGVSKNTALAVVKGKTWTHVT